jgi:hypothetical protein
VLTITVTLAAPLPERGHFDTVASAYAWIKDRAADLGLASHRVDWRFNRPPQP